MKQSEEVVRQEAQQQAEDAFNGFMLWMKRGTLWSCLFLRWLCLVAMQGSRMIHTPPITANNTIHRI